MSNLLRRGHRIQRTAPPVYNDEAFEVLEGGAVWDPADWDAALITEIGGPGEQPQRP